LSNSTNGTASSASVEFVDASGRHREEAQRLWVRWIGDVEELKAAAAALRLADLDADA
jgi:hypothetical protein